MSTEQKPFVPKTPMDFQKLKLERLMANPDKPVIIPEMPKEKKGFSVPEFVRNVMGSSAGAGSGEFHVYRHLRRKEYTRQKMIDAKGEKERLDEEYRNKIEENKRKMEEKTAKRRAKRLKRKQKLKQKGTKKLYKTSNEQDEESSSNDSENDHQLVSSEQVDPEDSAECNESSQDSFSPKKPTHSDNSCERLISKDSIS